MIFGLQPCTRLSLDPRLVLLRFLIAGLTLILPAACGTPTPPSSTPNPVPLAHELILYNWADYMPQSVLDAFEKEYGTRVIVLTYESQEEAVEKIGNDTIGYDIAVIEQNHLPQLIQSNLIAEIDYHNVPNFSNISADFRDLSFDPDNQHSVPYNWGTTGLIVRSDLVKNPVTKWADLWDPRHAGQIAIRGQPIEIISIALRSLGYPLNSEDPGQLDAALAHLRELKKSVVFIPADPQSVLDALGSGRITIVQGWNGDALAAREQYPSIEYVLPEEGTMLWADTFVISASSQNQYTAEVFLNFILRPEISAQIVETYYYPSANEAARMFIDPVVSNDPLVYPQPDYLRANDFYLPLSETGGRLYAQIWASFMEGNP